MLLSDLVLSLTTSEFERGDIIYTIYKIYNTINKKLYVGMTSNTLKRRLQQHCTDAKTIQSMKISQAMNKLGINHFYIEELEKAENREKAEALERYWIRKLNTLHLNGYNISKGGVSLKGEQNPFYNKTHTKETRKHLAKLASKRRGKLNPFYGKEHTKETKRKIGRANKGKRRSQEVKDYLSNINKGDRNPFYSKSHTEDVKKHLKQLKITKDIKMLSEDGEVLQNFKTMDEAVQFIKVSGRSTAKDKSIASAIGRAINKGTKSYGYRWDKIEGS